MKKPAKQSTHAKRAAARKAKPAAKTVAFNDSNPLARSSPGKLAGLLKLSETEATWNDDDLAAILRHQLEQPLEPIAEQYLPASGETLHQNPKLKKIHTFGDLFASAKPPAEILEIVRQYARDSRNAGELTLPPVISGAIYWLAIAAARATETACHTKLSKTEIEVGLKWLSDQKWVEEPLRKIARKAATKFN